MSCCGPNFVEISANMTTFIFYLFIFYFSVNFRLSDDILYFFHEFCMIIWKKIWNFSFWFVHNSMPYASKKRKISHLLLPVLHSRPIQGIFVLGKVKRKKEKKNSEWISPLCVIVGIPLPTVAFDDTWPVGFNDIILVHSFLLYFNQCHFIIWELRWTY